MVHYIQPYSTTKNIGGAINLAIETLVTTDDDWVVLLDHDVMFLRPDSKFQLEAILNGNHDFSILSCLTNRLAKRDIIAPGMFEETDIMKHIDMANQYHTAHYGKIAETRQNLAAMLMCFRVSTWKMLGRFAENSISFDSQFCVRAKRVDFKLGLMIGIYIFHLYRMGMEGEPRKNYQHLLPEN